ncbi:MAG: (deoxy)nucleoside triphosphate pyrophosphohydrolase [Pseudomonadota bacterium]
MEKKPTSGAAWLPVVAGALRREDGCWLMHRRPFEKHHGGLWEFPGGKVESPEMPTVALVRELKEELGISIDASGCVPIGFAQETTHDRNRPVVILLYRIDHWVGEPMSLEGGATGWFARDEILRLDKPPLDISLSAFI